MRSDSRIVIIAKSAHLDAVRLRTKYIMEALIVDVLNEPWSQSFAKRITRPHGQKEQKVKNTDSAYAQWIGEEGGEVAMQEFTALKSDPQRAKWLLHHMDEVVLYNQGKEIMEEYQAGAEVSLRGASPPEPPRQLQLNEKETVRAADAVGGMTRRTARNVCN